MVQVAEVQLSGIGRSGAMWMGPHAVDGESIDYEQMLDVLGARSRAPGGPERNLACAVLAQALREYTRSPEARAWCATVDWEPYGFDHLCDSVGLVPEAVRRVLAKRLAGGPWRVLRRQHTVAGH